MFNSEKIAQNFQQLAKEYDNKIALSIPYYNELIDSMVKLIPFNTHDSFRVIDLGCGTGTLSLAIKEKFPNAQITCMDLCENMLELALGKLNGYSGISFELDDFYTYNFTEKYDVAFSCLSLHHLTSDSAKKVFYNKIYDSLNYGGVFYNGDLVIGKSDKQKQLYVNKWRDYVLQRVSPSFLMEELLPKEKETDDPAPIVNQVEWLEDIGFRNVDVVFKYYNIGLFGGTKSCIYQ